MSSSDSVAILETGNSLKSSGRFEEALLEFDRVSSSPVVADAVRASALASAAESLLALRRAPAAVEKCKEALALSPGLAEARAQLALAHLASGNFTAAAEALDAEPCHPADCTALQDARAQLQIASDAFSKGDAALAAGNFKEAQTCFSELQKGHLFAALAVDVRLGKCHLGLNEFQTVLMYSRRILRIDSTSVVAHLLQAEIIFNSNGEDLHSDAWTPEAEKAVKMAKQALALDPDHKEAISLQKRFRTCIKDVASLRTLRSDDVKAEDLLTRLIDRHSCPGKFRARLCAERGRIRFERKDFDGCIADCSAACALDDRLAAAHVHWAQSLQQVDKYDEAVEVYERLHTWKKDDDTFWKMEWAKFEVRKKNRPDYYAVLGVSVDAKETEIKRRYLLACQEYHPDKTSRLEPEARAEAEIKFKLVQEAQECLGNSAKREYYDKGYDIQGIRECLQVRKRFAGQNPCTQCGEDESGKLGADGKWYCQICWDGFYRLNPDDPGLKQPANPGLGTSGLGAIWDALLGPLLAGAGVGGGFPTPPPSPQDPSAFHPGGFNPGAFNAGAFNPSAFNAGAFNPGGFAGKSPCAQCGEDGPGKPGADGKFYCQSCWDGFYRTHPDDPNAKQHLSAGARTRKTPATSSTSSPPQASRPTSAPSSPTKGPLKFDGPLPTKEEIQKMSIADLKDLLAKLHSGTVGCLTKDDMRERIFELLSRVQTPSQDLSAASAEHSLRPPPSTVNPDPASMSEKAECATPLLEATSASGSTDALKSPPRDSWAGMWSVPTPGAMPARGNGPNHASDAPRSATNLGPLPGGGSGSHLAPQRQSQPPLNQVLPSKFDVVDDFPIERADRERYDRQFEVVD